MTHDILLHQSIPTAATAAALLVLPQAPARVRLTALPRCRPPDPVSFGPPPVRRRVASGFGWLGRLRLRRQRAAPGDRLRLAAGLDVLAACLRAGLPVPTALGAAAAEMPGRAPEVLRRVAELVRLGSDPVQAWHPALHRPELVRLARRARRAAHSGAALADAASALAQELRAEAHDAAHAGAQRAAVLITAPLGLCFLPAFLCLGVAPVVIGLATRLLQSW